MKFLLRPDLGEATIRRIGNRLRARGSGGHHWIEKFRGKIFVNVVDSRDEEILRRDFADLVEPLDATPHGHGHEWREVGACWEQ